MQLRSHRRSRRSPGFCGARGLTLVELLVALAIGLLLVIAMSALFVGSSSSRRELEISADAIENGRYASDVLARELSQTGFYGPLIVPAGATSNADPDVMCGNDVAEWRDSLHTHVAGLNNGDADPGCIARKAGTDAIFVQRASTCLPGVGGCDAEDSNNAYIQVSECGDEYSVKPVVVDKGTETTFKLQTRKCDATVLAPKRRLVRRIYFVGTDEVLGYREITLAGVQDRVALVDGVEQLQFEYAIDDNDDGTPDRFESAPANADWPNAIGVRLWVLARSQQASRNASDAVEFEMGDTLFTVDAAATNPKRRVYSSYVPFVSPKLRRED